MVFCLWLMCVLFLLTVFRVAADYGKGKGDWVWMGISSVVVAVVMEA